ncbi:hypothetical protein [Paenirhodobacter enshiensis]|uniref:hypothetical protein n=1 Tax=Paenirhodobacter enshiensis TaxID=1105367 RepID=UPI003FA1BEDB
MDNDFLEEITTYCAMAGISPSTLGVRAIGNSRFVDRLRRRVEKTQADVQRVRAYIAANPPPQERGAA